MTPRIHVLSIDSFENVADLCYFRWYADGVVTTLAASFYAPYVMRFNRVIVKNECAFFSICLMDICKFNFQTNLQHFPQFLLRQHRPYPKEGAWHRLRHFTLAALRLPGDAMNLNYNPGLKYWFFSFLSQMLLRVEPSTVAKNFTQTQGWQHLFAWWFSLQPVPCGMRCVLKPLCGVNVMEYAWCMHVPGLSTAVVGTWIQFVSSRSFS